MTIINKEDFKIKKELNRPILSLDYGEKRIGIAISDNECSIALPSEVLERNNNEIILTSLGVGKYGRCLGEIKFTKSYIKSNKYHGKSLNIMLVKEGHAKEYKE